MKPALPLSDTSQARRSALVGGLMPSLQQALDLHAEHLGSQAHTVDYPAAAKTSTAGMQSGASTQARRVVGRPVQVQIVEDLPRVQQLLRQLVEQPGRFEVTGIDDTEQEAFQRSQAQPPDALVVDLNLRQGSGLGLIHAVRKLYGASPVGPLVIVVTNHTMPVLEAACLKAGADHFLDKSRELPRLSALLNQAFFP
ncbi:MAG: response regulator [Pseudomonadota bacterium]|uniref:response regulator n=1 Tax=Aquabacterium sp. TaxID=1872578 RepID=UPI003BAFF3BE